MKYNVKPLPKGHAMEPKWAVYQGNRKYFVDTVSTDKSSVEEEAKIMSMRWYYDQAQKIGEELLESDTEGHVKYWTDYLA